MTNTPTKESFALVIAIIAAVTSIGGAVIGTWSAHSLEREKWEQTTKSEAIKERNLAIAAFARNIAACGQETSWFLSKAANDAEQFSNDDIAAYDSDVKGYLAELVSSLFFVAAHDKQAYESLLPLSKQYFELDGAAAGAAKTFRQSREAGLKEFQRLATVHEDWLLQLPDRIAAVMSAPEK
jgi:hypothetical protein